MSQGFVSGEYQTENNNKIKSDLPARRNGFWPSIKAILFKEINVTLSPRQQKVEDFLNKEVNITMTPKQEEIINKIKAFLYQDISLSNGKKNKNVTCDK